MSGRKDFSCYSRFVKNKGNRWNELTIRKNAAIEEVIQGTKGYSVCVSAPPLVSPLSEKCTQSYMIED